jgi:hypothetical protein
MTPDIDIYNAVHNQNKKQFIIGISKINKAHEKLKIILNAFCNFCISDNLYILTKFYKNLIHYQNNKKDADKSIKMLCQILFHKYNIITLDQNTSNTIIQDYDVLSMLFRKTHTFSQLDEFRQIFVDDVVNCLDILWEIITKGWTQQRYEASIAICCHIKNIPKNLLYKKDVLIHTKLDYYDILFNFIMLFLDSYNFDESVKKYIKLCHTLFYYQCRTKDRILREPILYGCILALLKRNVLYERLHDTEIEDANTFEKLRKNPWAYLNALTMLDNELIEKVKSEKQSKDKCYIRKDIDIGEIGYFNIEGKRPIVMVQKN